MVGGRRERTDNASRLSSRGAGEDAHCMGEYRTQRATTYRLLKTAHLLRWRASALIAAYLQYAWTHLRWAPRRGYPSARMGDAALHLDHFEQSRQERFLACYGSILYGRGVALARRGTAARSHTVMKVQAGLLHSFEQAPPSADLVVAVESDVVADIMEGVFI
jgi:hypothetical protein